MTTIVIILTILAVIVIAFRLRKDKPAPPATKLPDHVEKFLEEYMGVAQKPAVQHTQKVCKRVKKI